MKLFTKYLLILLAGLVVISCSDDDDDNNPINNGGNGNYNPTDPSSATVQITGDVTGSFQVSNATWSFVLNSAAYSNATVTIWDENLDNGMVLTVGSSGIFSPGKEVSVYENEDDYEFDGGTISVDFTDGNTDYVFEATDGTITVTNAGEDFCSGSFDVNAYDADEDKTVRITGTFHVNEDD